MLARHLNAIGAPGRSNCRGHDKYSDWLQLSQVEKNTIGLDYRCTCHFSGHSCILAKPVAPMQAARCIVITLSACAWPSYVLPKAVQCKALARPRLQSPSKTSVFGAAQGGMSFEIHNAAKHLSTCGSTVLFAMMLIDVCPARLVHITQV